MIQFFGSCITITNPTQRKKKITAAVSELLETNVWKQRKQKKPKGRGKPW